MAKRTETNRKKKQKRARELSSRFASLYHITRSESCTNLRSNDATHLSGLSLDDLSRVGVGRVRGDDL